MLGATWQVTNCKNDVSVVGLALQITLKPAWLMDHRIRFSLGVGPGGRLSGQLGAYEAYVGGKARIMQRGSGPKRITGTGGKGQTDALKSYEGLDDFQREVIDGAVEYARGEVHTNGL